MEIAIKYNAHVTVTFGVQDLRLVRDKFTQVSRGFAFVHFNSVCSLIVDTTGWNFSCPLVGCKDTVAEAFYYSVSLSFTLNITESKQNFRMVHFRWRRPPRHWNAAIGQHLKKVARFFV